MKTWQTSDTGPYQIKKNTGRLVKEAANKILAERNGGLPENLHTCNRSFLLQTIKRLHQELIHERTRKS